MYGIIQINKISNRGCYVPWCSKTSTFSWDIYLDTRVVFFQVFGTSPGHVLHLSIGVAYLFRAFTHQIICVHPKDAPEILHFPRTFTQMPGLFLLGFLHFFPGQLPGYQDCFFQVFCTCPGHVLYFYMCVAYIFRIFTHQICVHAGNALELPHFPWTFTWMPELFFSGFLHIPGTFSVFLDVCGIFIQSNYLPNYFVYMLQMLQKFHIFLGHLPRFHVKM